MNCTPSKITTVRGKGPNGNEKQLGTATYPHLADNDDPLYHRHNGGSNYAYAESHAKFLKWGKARLDQYLTKWHASH